MSGHYVGRIPLSKVPHPESPIHAMKEQKMGEGTNRTVTSRCGITGAPPYKERDGLRCSIWNEDVTCPVCKRMGMGHG